MPGDSVSTSATQNDNKLSFFKDMYSTDMFEAAPDSRSRHLGSDLKIWERLVTGPIGTREGGVAIQLLTLPLPEDSLTKTKSCDNHVTCKSRNRPFSMEEQNQQRGTSDGTEGLRNSVVQGRWERGEGNADPQVGGVLG